MTTGCVGYKEDNIYFKGRGKRLLAFQKRAYITPNVTMLPTAAVRKEKKGPEDGQAKKEASM